MTLSRILRKDLRRYNILLDILLIIPYSIPKFEKTWEYAFERKNNEKEPILHI